MLVEPKNDDDRDGKDVWSVSFGYVLSVNSIRLPIPKYGPSSASFCFLFWYYTQYMTKIKWTSHNEVSRAKMLSRDTNPGP